jgi:multidrug efflux pump subunit AcrA (membrane-fusion protein)
MAGGAGLLALAERPIAGGPAAVGTVPVNSGRVARGEVHPEQEARLRNFTPGVVSILSASAGAQVNEGQELARIRSADGSIELVNAPWRGTVTSVPARLGDSVPVGTLLVTVGDLSRLHVETTDVDEFLIGQVWTGLPVGIALDALPTYDLTGVVTEVSIQTETTPEGDQHYPVTVRFDWTPPEVRPGMTARVRLPA